MTPLVMVCDDIESMSQAAAQGFVDIVTETLRRDTHVSISLSGGSTPQLFYETLAREFIDVIPWERILLFWGDERYVPQRDRRSNFHMFHEALLYQVNIPLSNLHPMPTHRKNPDDAAMDYERYLRSEADHPIPRFDLIMLGMGTDGHTASLFPHSQALDETERLVVATEAPVEPKSRLTATLPLINAARHVCFLVAGEDKAEVLNRVLSGDADGALYPASTVCPDRGKLIWWIDRAAASRLDDKTKANIQIEYAT